MGPSIWLLCTCSMGIGSLLEFKQRVNKIAYYYGQVTPALAITRWSTDRLTVRINNLSREENAKRNTPGVGT